MTPSLIPHDHRTTCPHCGTTTDRRQLRAPAANYTGRWACPDCAELSEDD